MANIATDQDEHHKAAPGSWKPAVKVGVQSSLSGKEKVVCWFPESYRDHGLRQTHARSMTSLPTGVSRLQTMVDRTHATPCCIVPFCPD